MPAHLVRVASAFGAGAALVLACAFAYLQMPAHVRAQEVACGDGFVPTIALLANLHERGAEVLVTEPIGPMAGAEEREMGFLLVVRLPDGPVVGGFILGPCASGIPTVLAPPKPQGTPA